MERHGQSKKESGAAARRTRQRSFRLPESTLELLEARARERGESGNHLAEQLLYEGLRTRDHPLIYFRQGTLGDRRPALIGARLYIWQVIHTLRASQGSIENASGYLELAPAQVQACVSYYADFKDEVDSHAEEVHELARVEQDRWGREREVLG